MVVDGKLGFTKEAFETIKNKVVDNKVYCNLTVDEMCVKRHIEIDTQQNMYGHINLGQTVIMTLTRFQLLKMHWYSW